MGFDYFAGSCDTIEIDVIERIAPGPWAAFQDAVAQVAATFAKSPDDVLADVGREEQQSDRQYDDDADYCKAVTEQVMPALDQLCQSFTAATNGIGLNIGWVDSDTFRGSDLNDEVVWYITGHQQPTPAYQAFAAIHGEAITKIWISGG